MPDYNWPTELDSRDRLLEVAGSFWADTYAGNGLTGSLFLAKAQNQLDAHYAVLGLADAVSRFKVRPFDAKEWVMLPLRESERNAPNLPKFAGTYSFDSGIFFDTPEQSSMFAWTVPTDLASAQLVLDGIQRQSACYVRGLDFFLADGGIWFRDDPFSRPGVRVVQEFKDGAPSDRVAYLWVYRGLFERRVVFNQFGYVVGMAHAPGETYRDAVNAVYDALVEGTTVRAVQDFFCAVCDVPVAKSDETVRRVVADRNHKWVFTDANAYRFSLSDTITAAVGQAVAAGDSLSQGLVFAEFNRGQDPTGVLRSLAVGRGLLAAGFFRELVFENDDVPLEVREGVDGYTRVSFRVQGWPGDVEKFWDDVHAAGVAAGDTLAMRLDTREVKTGQPTSAALPQTVNPLRFLLDNVFRGNLLVVKIRPAAFGPNALGLAAAARQIRRIVPPQVLCVVAVELEYDGDAVTMDGPGDETKPGYGEEVDTYLGCSYTDDVDPGDYVDEEVTAVYIGGHCQ